MVPETDGILNIDGFGWAALKLSDAERERLAPEDRERQAKAEQDTFKRYHQELREWIEANKGKVWATIGDCTIASGFPDIDHALDAAMTIQKRLSDFNRHRNQLPNPLIVRIGVTRGNLPNVPVKQRGEHSAPELDEAGHLQKDCPPGRIRISRSAHKTLRFHQRDFRPGLTVDMKSASAGSLVWIQRSLTPHDEEHSKKLPSRQQRCYPMIAASSKDFLSRPYGFDFTAIPEILQEAFVIIGETRTKIPPESPISHLAATSDAVGVIEVFAALQASSNLLAGIDEWVDCEDLATHKNIVIVGSPVVNVYAYAVNTVSPAGFVQEPDGLVRIRVPESKGPLFFPKIVEHSGFDRHYGLVLLSRNPINPKYHMIWIAGISGMATQAAARFVRDLVLNPTQPLSAVQNGAVEKPSIAVVAPDWQSGWNAEDYQGALRVSKYRILWLGSQASRAS